MPYHTEAKLFTVGDFISHAGLPLKWKIECDAISPEQWSAQTKLAVVAETYTMTEHELSTYCRSKGLYPEQIHTWREECLHGFRSSKEKDAEAKQQYRADKLEIKALKKELRYKEKALAETSALLVLRKKLRAFYGEEDEVD